ncbi:hypothetical protein DFH06DRAFT_1312809 [Mycena polygramma]|nr:hypothetical protein DFH06DRAFT_1312809 [Mycena polygramma]
MHCAALIAILFSLSLTSARPAVPNSGPRANPASLLGRSYTRRVPESPVDHRARRLALGVSTRQLDSHSPLGRAARFQTAQRRVANPSGSLGTAAGKNGAQRGHGFDAREILLSHQQAVPAPAPSLTPPAPAPTPAPATPTPTSVPSIPPQVTAAPGSRVGKKLKSKPKPKSKKTKAATTHKAHKTSKVARVSAE